MALCFFKLRLSLKLFMRVTLLLTILFIFPLWILAQGDIYTGSLLWRISGSDNQKPSYILASHHLIDTSFISEIPGLQDAFSNCEAVVGEVDLRDKLKMDSIVEQTILVKEKKDLYKTLLSEDDYNNLDRYLQVYCGASLPLLSKYKPMVISTFLTLKSYADINPKFNPAQHISIDEYVQKQGLTKRKEVVGLETIEEQVALLYAQPFEEQLTDLMCSFHNLEKDQERIAKLEQYYKEARLSDIYTLSFETDEDDACQFGQDNKLSLLDNRNNNWLKKLPQIFEANASFVVIGALHLVGEEGLLNQLAQLGYEVTPVL